MPEDAIIFADKWEFWIDIYDTSSSGVTEGGSRLRSTMAIRVLVEMRSS